MKPNDAAIRKRTQIAKANQTMFLWIAGASAIVGAAIVVSIFFGQKLLYTERVLAKKQDTVTTLKANIEVVESLKDEVRLLDTNTDLASVKANETDQVLQVILDALPSDANSLALGASLQNKLLNGIDGLELDALQVDPVVGVETLTGGDGATEPVLEEGAEASVITFQFIVSGPEASLRQALQNLERSIRAIKVNSVRMEIQSSGPVMTVQAQAYYEPSRTLELKKEKVEP